MFEFARTLQQCHAFQPDRDDMVLVLAGKNTILSFAGTQAALPCRKEMEELGSYGVIFIGMLDDRRCFAREIPESSAVDLPEPLRLYPIRQFLFEFPESWRMALCRARELLFWQGKHRFCGQCGTGLIASENDSGLNCPACRSVYYPQLAPAVIVGVTRNGGKELLLAHNRTFAGNMYSLIAGFVEAGENVEAAIHREIWEETSLRVKNLRYVASQVWPFPNSLMLAFTAEYESGTAQADGEELSDLGWFTAEDHPELPSPGSVAREVIDRIFNQ